MLWESQFNLQCFLSLHSGQVFGSGRRSNWSFLGSVMARQFLGKQRETPVRDGLRNHCQFATKISIPGANRSGCCEAGAELIPSALGAPDAPGLPLARRKTLLPPIQLKITSILVWKQPPTICFLHPQNKIRLFFPQRKTRFIIITILNELLFAMRGDPVGWKC